MLQRMWLNNTSKPISQSCWKFYVVYASYFFFKCSALRQVPTSNDAIRFSAVLFPSVLRINWSSSLPASSAAAFLSSFSPPSSPLIYLLRGNLLEVYVQSSSFVFLLLLLLVTFFLLLYVIPLHSSYAPSNSPSPFVAISTSPKPPTS